MHPNHQDNTASSTPAALAHYGSAWLAAALALALLTTVYAYILFSALEEFETRVYVRQAAALSETQVILRNRMWVLEGDLRFMAANPVIKRFLGQGADKDRQLMNQLMADLMETRRNVYDQLRYLDESGMEIVRINNTPERTRIVPRDQLQNKGDRYYFTRSIGLQTAEGYISPLDLNVENGQIEQPLKPMLRLSTRARDDEGRLRGVMVINYLGRQLLDRLRDAGLRLGQEFWLVNQDGHWLLGPSGDEWGFMFPDRASRSFAATHATAWRQMQQLRPGQAAQMTEGDSLMSVLRLVPAEDFFMGDLKVSADTGMQWYLISRLPAEQQAHARQVQRNRLLPSYLILALILAGLGALVAVLLQRRRDALDAVVQREAEYAALLEAAPDAIVVTDEHGGILMTNAVTEKMFGFARAALIGQPVETFMPASFHEDHRHHRTGYLGEPATRAMGEGRVLFARRQDGVEFPVTVGLSSYLMGSDRRIIAVVRDISDLHRLLEAEQAARHRLESTTDELAHMNLALTNSNKELDAFSYSVSHDLRAPLRAIDGFSKILLKKHAAQLDEQGRELLERMRAATKRMGHLIDDMLVLSRISRAELVSEDFDLSALVGEVAMQLREAFPERMVETVIQPDIHARGDPKLVRIVLDNLLGNAWKFTAKTGHARVEFAAETREGKPGYVIRDNGAGFDMAYADKLFGAFQRLHSASEFPGSGIGLATVARVVHKHGGEVRAQGAIGEGASFWFSLQP